MILWYLKTVIENVVYTRWAINFDSILIDHDELKLWFKRHQMRWMCCLTSFLVKAQTSGISKQITWKRHVLIALSDTNNTWSYMWFNDITFWWVFGWILNVKNIIHCTIACIKAHVHVWSSAIYCNEYMSFHVIALIFLTLTFGQKWAQFKQINDNSNDLSNSLMLT